MEESEQFKKNIRTSSSSHIYGRSNSNIRPKFNPNRNATDLGRPPALRDCIGGGNHQPLGRAEQLLVFLLLLCLTNEPEMIKNPSKTSEF